MAFTELKKEIERLARKQAKAIGEPTRQLASNNRHSIAGLRLRIVALEKRVSQLEKTRPRPIGEVTGTTPSTGMRFTVAGLRSHRAKLGISAADYGKLIGTTGKAIYSWENGHALPRKGVLKRYFALRHMSKKEALALLERIG